MATTKTEPKRRCPDIFIIFGAFLGYFEKRILYLKFYDAVFMLLLLLRVPIFKYFCRLSSSAVSVLDNISNVYVSTDQEDRL